MKREKRMKKIAEKTEKGGGKKERIGSEGKVKEKQGDIE